MKELLKYIKRGRSSGLATLTTGILLVAVVVEGCGGGGWKESTDPGFRVGQRWAYNARAGEEATTALVTGVARHPERGTVIHAEVTGLRIYNPQTGAIEPGAVRLAMTRSAFESSVTKLVRDGEKVSPGTEAALREWYRSDALPDDRTIIQAIDQLDQSNRNSGGNRGGGPW